MDLPPQGKADTVMGMSRDAFLARLRKGYAIQTGVAFAFLSEGFTVTMPKYSEDDSDHFDLRIGDDDYVEVKGRNLTFTGPDDFPYDTILVTTAARWSPQRLDPPYLPNNDTVTVKHMVDKQKKVRDRFILSPTSELFTLEELFNRLKE
jgi:hypothetical protein